MDIATLGIAVESRQVATANDNLARLKREAGGAERATKGFEAGAKKATTATGRMADQAKRAHSVFLRLSGILSVIGVSLGIGALVRYADTWSDINARVGLAIGNMDAAGIVMDRLSDVARRTYSALNLTAEGFIRNATVLKELGKSTTEQLDFTESLNLAMVVSGAKADRAARLQEALGKAMALGQLRGEELNSVIQVGGRVAEVLAEELGIGVNQLRQFGMDGKITGDVIYNALTKRLESLRAEAELMPATIGDAFTLVGNAMLRLVGVFDQNNKLSESLAMAIIGVADSLGILVKAIAVAGVGLLTYFAPAILSGIAFGLGYIGAAGVHAMRMIAIAVAANPLGALILGVNIVLTALYLFRDEIKQVIGIDLIDVVKGAANRIIGMFVGAYEAVKEAWGNLPTFFSAIGKAAWNNLVSEFEKPALTWGDTVLIPGLDLSALKSELSEAQKLALNAASVTFNANLDTDYIGQLAERAGLTGEATAATFDLTTATTAATAALTKEQEAVRELIKDLEFEVSLFGKSAMQREVDINLRKAGTAATEKQRESITRLTETLFKLREAYDFVADVTKGFFTDLKSGLQNGEGIWQSFASAATNALDKISNKLLDMALDQAINGLFSKLLGAVAGGFGGGFGSMATGAPMNLLPNAKGGIQSGAGISAFSNSIVNSPTVFPFARGTGLMGEAGPEAIMPLKRGPDGTLGVAGGGGGGRLDIRLYVDQDGNWQAAVENIAGTVADVRVDYNNRFTVPRIVMAQKGNTMVETGKAA